MKKYRTLDASIEDHIAALEARVAELERERDEARSDWQAALDRNERGGETIIALGARAERLAGALEEALPIVMAATRVFMKHGAIQQCRAAEGVLAQIRAALQDAPPTPPPTEEAR